MTTMTDCTHRYEDAADGMPCALQEHPDNPNGHSYIGTSGVANCAKEE
jgi:hypothetical protein